MEKLYNEFVRCIIPEFKRHYTKKCTNHDLKLIGVFLLDGCNAERP